jgi:hypothetical protein
MTGEDIIRMAREAGALFDHITFVERDLAPVFKRFADLVAAAERRACLKICDEIENEAYQTYRKKYEPYDEGFSAGALACFEAITKRGQT